MDKRIPELIKNYLDSRDGLKELGILRSERNLQGDYAEWLVAEKLNLILADSAIQKGFDATGNDSKTYQIKSRMVTTIEDRTSLDFQDLAHEFDYLIGVFFSKRLEVIQMIRVPYKTVVELAVKNKTNYRFRWNRESMQNTTVEILN